MIVHDYTSLEEALKLLDKVQEVRLKDEFRFTVHNSREELSKILNYNLDHSIITLVVPLGNPLEKDYKKLQENFRKSLSYRRKVGQTKVAAT